MEIGRVINGSLVKNNKYPIYSDIEDTLARRTFDESGNYSVRPFPVTMNEHILDATHPLGIFTPAQGGDITKLSAGMSPGKAFIQGYEMETIGTEYVAIEKARDKIQQANHTISIPSGTSMVII